jgi:hypothetical protein
MRICLGEIKMSVKRILIAAANLIKNIGWTQGAFARDRYGATISPTRPEAACFCAAGAIISVACLRNSSSSEISEAEFFLRRRIGNVEMWNDKPGQTAENVIKTLRECAEELDD